MLMPELFKAPFLISILMGHYRTECSSLIPVASLCVTPMSCSTRLPDNDQREGEIPNIPSVLRVSLIALIRQEVSLVRLRFLMALPYLFTFQRYILGQFVAIITSPRQKLQVVLMTSERVLQLSSIQSKKALSWKRTSLKC